MRQQIGAALGRLSRGKLVALGAVAGVASVALIVAIIGVLIVGGGLYNVAASRHHGLLVSWVLHTTMIRSVKAHAGRPGTSLAFSPEQVQNGFSVYDTHCAMCHGGPGVARAPLANGMEPSPPYLMDAAEQWTPQELRFIIAEGVKMTAMPSWKHILSESQQTSVVAFLEALPGMKPAQYQAMRRARQDFDQRNVTRQTALPGSSAISGAPRVSATSPTGRP